MNMHYILNWQDRFSVISLESMSREANPCTINTGGSVRHMSRLCRDRVYECVVWCGVVWCGVVWCGVVWCGVVWCGVVWCGVVWCGVVWCGVVWCSSRKQIDGCSSLWGSSRSAQRPIRGMEEALSGELPLHGAARCRGRTEEAIYGGAHAARDNPIDGGRKLFLWELPSHGAGRRRGRSEEALSGGAHDLRGCPLENLREEALFGGAPAAQGCPLKGLREGGSSFWGAQAARGCSIEGGRKLFLGGSYCAGLPVSRGKEGALYERAQAARNCSIVEKGGSFLGELLLRRAARLREGEGLFGGSSRCVGLLNVEGGWGGRRIFLGRPRCAGLLDGGRKEALSWGAHSARGCTLEGWRELFLGYLPLHGAAR